MNNTVIITLSDSGARLAMKLAAAAGNCHVYLHKVVAHRYSGKRFNSVRKLTVAIFGKYRNLIYIMPCGVVVRAINGLPDNKLNDPAVVVVDAAGRYAISLLSGHEGGANSLALFIGNILGTEPVISTTTDALKDVIVGVGCRRGAKAGDITDAVVSALKKAKVEPGRVRYIATADIKADEKGLIAAAGALGFPLRLVTSDEIRSTMKTFKHSKLVKSKVQLPAVAEPAALLAGRRTSLLLPRIIIKSITVAVARENFS